MARSIGDRKLLSQERGMHAQNTCVVHPARSERAALAWGSATNSNEKSAVAAVAQNYMDAYYTSDSARMQKVLHPDFHKRTLTVSGHTEISEDTVQSMLEGVLLGKRQGNSHGRSGPEN